MNTALLVIGIALGVLGLALGVTGLALYVKGAVWTPKVFGYEVTAEGDKDEYSLWKSIKEAFKIAFHSEKDPANPKYTRGQKLQASGWLLILFGGFLLTTGIGSLAAGAAVGDGKDDGGKTPTETSVPASTTPTATTSG